MRSARPLGAPPKAALCFSNRDVNFCRNFDRCLACTHAEALWPTLEFSEKKTAWISVYCILVSDGKTARVIIQTSGLETWKRILFSELKTWKCMFVSALKSMDVYTIFRACILFS